MATTFDNADEARARYNEIAKGLLTGDASGTKYGHNQIFWDGSKFVTGDLRYKQGDPGNLVKQGQNVADTLNQVVNEFGLDTSKLQKGQGLGSVRYDPGAGVKTDAASAFNAIFGANFQDQFQNKLAGYQPPPAAAAPPSQEPPPPPPPPPPQYGQPPLPPPPQPPAGPPPDAAPPPVLPPAPDQGLASLPTPAAPSYGSAPQATPDGAPGYQMPSALSYSLPGGPTIGGAYARASAAGDPFMAYRPPVYREPPTGDQAYEQMGLRTLARYAQGTGAKEANYFPNRSRFLLGPTPDKFSDEAQKSGAAKIYEMMYGG